MGKLTEITWPAEFAELKRIEELLLCGICYEYMKTSVMAPCSHNYCSVCIRKYLHYKTQCPACFEQTYEKDLRINRTLDEILQNYLKIRDKLGACVKDAKVISESEIAVEKNSPPTRPARNSQTIKTSKRDNLSIKTPKKQTQEQPSQNEKTIPEPKPEILQEKTPIRNVSSPGTSQGSKKIASFFNSPINKPVQNNVEMVSCPICNVEVSSQCINKHLDACLKRESGVVERPKEIPKLKPLPKLVLSVMKDAELRKKLKELGLSIQGDRKTIESRYHKYLIIHNAECDKSEPRSIPELLKQSENEEMQEKKMQRMAVMGIKLQVNRNNSLTVIEEAHKKYRETNKSNFESLIQDIKQRKSVKAEEVCSSSSNSPIKSKKDFENASNVSYTGSEEGFFYSAENDVFHDSDSSTPCPLQRYTSDNPMKYLNVKFSDSEASNSPMKKQEISTISTPNNPSTSWKEDIFNVSTDSDTTDPDGTFETPQRRKQRVNKRLKLCQQSTGNKKCLSPETLIPVTPKTDDSKQREEAAKALAESIADDFSFNSLDDDILATSFCDATVVLEESPISAPNKVSAPEFEKKQLDFETYVVHRPLRKRNLQSRALSETPVSSEKKDTTKKILHETGNASVENVDGTLKRRRGKVKSVPKTSNEIENLPKRPLRRRISKSTEQSNEPSKKK